MAKLANFAEIDVYVLVACPENTLVDSSEFYRPIITPYELEVACNQAQQWTGDYYTDFRELLPGEYCNQAREWTGDYYTDFRELLPGEYCNQALEWTGTTTRTSWNSCQLSTVIRPESGPGLLHGLQGTPAR